MMIIHDWLNDKIAERRPNVVACLDTSKEFEDPAEFVGEALALKVAALAEGYSEKELLDACGGDVARFVMSRQNHSIHHGVAYRH